MKLPVLTVRQFYPDIFKCFPVGYAAIGVVHKRHVRFRMKMMQDVKAVETPFFQSASEAAKHTAGTLAAFVVYG
jgi:hypothetical protein